MSSRRPRRPPAEPRPVLESLDRVVRQLGGTDAASTSALFTRWEEIAGEYVAAHARPLSFRDGVLVLGVEQPAWRLQVVFLEPDLRRRLAEVAGVEVARVEVRVRRR